MMEKMMKQMGKGKMPALPGLRRHAGAGARRAARRRPARAPHDAEEDGRAARGESGRR